jgi:hypothetical protein
MTLMFYISIGLKFLKSKFKILHVNDFEETQIFYNENSEKSLLTHQGFLSIKSLTPSTSRISIMA